MSSVYTILSDSFTGTAGTSVVGRTPDTVQSGSDVYGDGSSLGSEGVFKIAAGGVGAVSSGAAGDGCWSFTHPLTGVPGGQGVYAISHTPVNVTQLDVFLRANTGAGLTDGIAVNLNSSSQTAQLIVLSGGTSVYNSGATTVAMSAGTPVDVEVDLADTTVTVKVNGSIPSGMGAITIPSAPSNSKFYIRQENGSAGDLKVNSLTLTTPGPTSATVTGPTAITEGVASGNYTITLGSAVPAGGAGITLTPSVTVFSASPTPGTVHIAPGASTGTFTETASTTGTGTVTASATAGVSGLSVTPQSGVTAGPAGPTSATFSGPSSGNVGSPSTNFTITLNSAAISGGQAISLSDGSAGGTFAGSGVSGSTLTIASGQTAGTFTYTAASTGAKVLTPTSVGITFTPTSLTYTASAAAASSYTLADASPASGFVLNASGNLTLQANGTPSVALVVTPASSIGGDTFTPTSLTINDAGAHTFVLVPSATTGARTISTTHTGGGFSGDPSSVSYTANARTLAVAPSSVTTSGSGTLTFTGAGTKWTSSAPTFGPTGVGGFTLGSVNVSSDTSCTASYTTSTTAGTETFTDSTTSARATLTVVAQSIHNQLQVYYSTPSLGTVYYVINQSGNKAWNGSAFEAIVAGHWPSYAISGSDAAGVGIYLADFPAAIPPGTYAAYAYLRAGGSAAPTDLLLAISNGQWDGTTFGPAGASQSFPTLEEIADAILTRDWTEVVPSTPDRCALQALRFLRNAWATTSDTLTVTAEDDVTTAWAKQLLTNSDALPVTGLGGD